MPRPRMREEAGTMADEGLARTRHNPITVLTVVTAVTCLVLALLGWGVYDLHRKSKTATGHALRVAELRGT